MNNINENINKSKTIIKEEKKKLKIERAKLRKKKVKKSKIINFFRGINIFKKGSNETYSFKEMIIIMFFSLGLGFFACFSFVKIFSGGKSYLALSKDLSKLVDTYYAIVDNYYGDVDTDLLVEDAIKGMVSSIGDIYTNYSNANDTIGFNETIGGTYDGIGATVGNTNDGKIIVVSLFIDGPAQKAGLKEGDVITKIDNTHYEGKTSTDVANYIKNSKKGKVILTILRDNEEKEITISLAKVEIPSVNSEIFETNNKKVGYIQVSLFSLVTKTQFKTALEKLEKEKIDGLVIDVRDNGGGYLNIVTEITDMFLKKGQVVYKLQDEDGLVEKKDNTKESRNYPVAVLTNQASASASEILAAAIKETYGGYIVGTNTYGKGTVQQTMNLPDGSMVKYTIQNWLTPKGNWLNEVGLEPTDIVELNEEYYSNPSYERDNQLQKALELISQKK